MNNFIKLPLIFFGLCALILGTNRALTQSTPGLIQGQVPTAQQWNFYFSQKQDFLGATPLLPTAVGAVPPIIATPTSSTTSISIGTGNSVTNPGTGLLENTTPVQTIGPQAAYNFSTPDLFQFTKRTNNNATMSDNLPAASLLGMVNGTKLEILNIDSTATDTLTAAAGTTVLGQPTFILQPGRDIALVYDALHTNWVSQANSSFNPGQSLPAATTPGTLAVWNGTAWTAFTGNTGATAFLQETSNGIPSWQTSAVSANSVTNAQLATASANTIKGNPTAATANEQDMPVPSCTGTNHALLWTAGTGFTCGSPVITPGQLPGTTTNDNASSGNVGEFVSLTNSAPIALPNQSAAALIGVTIGPGDFDLYGNVEFTCSAGGTLNFIAAWLGPTNGSTATFDAGPVEIGLANPGFACAGIHILNLPTYRVPVGTTQTVFLNIQISGTGTVTGLAFLRGRRMR